MVVNFSGIQTERYIYAVKDLYQILTHLKHVQQHAQTLQNSDINLAQLTNTTMTWIQRLSSKEHRKENLELE